jgi:eukaryotic-like serine/threonine-protein kinase
MEVGDRVGTQVELRRPLGAGGMGTLWVGFHLGLQTEVAVKFLAEDFASNEEAIARFGREAAIAAKVRSPHIVQQLDHGIASDGSPYIVMELLRGNDLESALREHGGFLSPALTLELVRQTCRALSVAHEASVVHRDIKPANIFLIDNDGEPFVKLLDFGIARDHEVRTLGLTQTGTLMGTPIYMSPEQLFQNAPIDRRTDLWALAVVVYQCLTGKLPFGGETLPSISVAIAGRNYDAPTQVSPQLPAGLNAWFAKAFAEPAEQRFQSARELADELSLALGRAPSVAAFVAVPSATAGSEPVHDARNSAHAATARVDAPRGGVEEAQSAQAASGLDAAPAAAQTLAPAAGRSRLWFAGALALFAFCTLGAVIAYRAQAAASPQGLAPPASTTALIESEGAASLALSATARTNQDPRSERPSPAMSNKRPPQKTTATNPAAQVSAPQLNSGTGSADPAKAASVATVTKPRPTRKDDLAF